MRKFLFAVVLVAVCCSFLQVRTLKGTWEYQGGWVNGKYFPPPAEHKQQRKYTDAQFDAFVVEKGKENIKYESGFYTLKGDTCLETQTFCLLEDQSMVNVNARYVHSMRHDTLVLKGKLPNGTIVEDYWKKVK